ncbi:MAG: response regulator [Pseudomonadota bacterium]
MFRIIVADDSSMARMFIQRCLEIAGFSDAKFIQAVNGEEVKKILEQEPADVVVTDLNMPKMDGTELLKWIKSTPALKNIPVVIISSTTNKKKVAELEELGAFAILGKPLSPPVAVAALTPLLEKLEAGN